MNKYISQFYQILKLSRPSFWFYLAGPFFVGFTFGAQSLIDFNMDFFILLFYFLIPANILVYSINDLADEKIDILNAKKENKEIRVNESNKIAVKIAFYFSLFCSLLVLFMLKDQTSILLFLAFIFLSIFYSLPPIRFKTKIFLDFISNILYILPGILGFYEATSLLPNWIFILASMFWAFAMHLFSAVVDIEPDTKANIKTSAVYLGLKKSLLLCFLFWSISWLLIWYSGVFNHFVYIFMIYPLLPLYVLWKKNIDLERVYWWYPVINIVLGFILFLLAYFN
jgi:4-hydroxybenzoate polyprenyltransferase